jgi:protein-S-isoprenylcysteine O-methyltransferase Ste14
MSTLVKSGQFAFRYRGYLLPIAILLFAIPGPQFNAQHPEIPGIIGFLVAMFGQALRIANIGLAYIIRGGKDHQVYAEKLVTEGLYSHVRNPMYVGNFFLILGMAIAANTWHFMIIGIPLALGMHRAIIAAEENFLRNKFGAAFDAYCARVRRWVPRLGGITRTLEGMEFQWRRVLLKEYLKPFDWLSAIALMIVVNLLRAHTFDDHPGLVTLMLLVIIVRVLLSFVARSMQKQELAAGQS